MLGACYFDTSALVKFYFVEPGSEEVQRLLASGPPPFLSPLCIVEFHSACASRTRVGDLDVSDFDTRVADLSDDIRDGRYHLLTAHISVWFHRAGNVLRAIGTQRALRSLDALHLAAALLIREQAPDLTLVSSDVHLLAAARAAELATLNPTAGAHGT